MSMEDIYRVGGFVLFVNALVAFLLNVSVVFLVGFPLPYGAVAL